MKKCVRCKQELNVNQFNKNKSKKDGLSDRCKDCNSKYLKEYYYKNQQVEIQKRIKQKEKIRKKFKEFKQTLSCLICGENDYRCLDFHHRDSSSKFKPVSQMVYYSETLLLQEVEKCSILCANCHRKITIKGR